MADLILQYVVKIERRGDESRFVSKVDPLSWSSNPERAHEFAIRADAVAVAKQVQGAVRDWLLPVKSASAK